jgi:hypothetical protein
MELYSTAITGGYFNPKKMINAKIICSEPPNFSEVEGFGSLNDFAKYLYSGPMKLLATVDIPAGKEIIALYDLMDETQTAVPNTLPIGAASKRAKLTKTQKELEEHVLRSSSSEEETQPRRHKNVVTIDEPSHESASSSSEDDNKEDSTPKKQKKSSPMTQQEFEENIPVPPCLHYPECRFPGQLVFNFHWHLKESKPFHLGF